MNNFRGTGTRRRWTDEEMEILEKYYPIEGFECAKRLPERTVKAISLKAERCGIYANTGRGNGKRWTEDEIAIIKEHFPSRGRRMAYLLPGRSKTAVIARAYKLGIRVERGSQSKWTKKEDAILKKWFPKMRYECRVYLPGRSDSAIRHRIMKIGPGLKNRLITHVWTDEDVRILKEYYPLIGGEVTSHLPHHPISSIYTTASRLGIHFYDV